MALTDTINKLKNSIISKTNALISAHNSDNSAHSSLFNGKADSSHTHGNLQNNGQIGSTAQANKNVITDANGKITTGEMPASVDVSNKIDTAGTGLSKSGTTLNHSNSVTALTSASLKKIKYDSQGHITGTGDLTSTDLSSIDGVEITDTIYTHPSTKQCNYAYSHPSTHAASMITGLATVATSGSYNDLSNKPTIPATVTVDSSLSTTSTNPVQNKVINSALSGKSDSGHTHSYAPTNHASYTTAYGVASTDTYGHVMLYNGVSSTSTTLAATANAVKTAYDKGNHSHPYASSTHNHDGTYLKSYTPPTASTSQAGIVQLNSATNSTSTTQAATPSAVKAAYDLANGKPSLGTTSTTAAAGNHTHSNYLTSHQDISGKIDTAGTGLSKSGTTLNHSNSITALTTASLKKVKYDAQGHITGTSDVTSTDLSAIDGVKITDTVYSHPTPNSLGGAKSSGLYKISTDANGHVTGTASVGASDLPSHNHTLSNITDLTTTSMVVTYTDNTTEIIQIPKYTGS